MGFISNTLGEQTMENFKLANKNESGKQFSSQKEIKPIKPVVNFSDLEMAFKSDAITFNAINKSGQMIMSGGFKKFIHKQARVVKKYLEFFENIGDIGNDITFDELLENIFRDQMVYGNAFVEIIFDSDTDSKIVDLAPIDPKRIDYAKTSDGRIILDSNGKPIGYTLKLDYGTTADGDDIPKEYERTIQKEENSIFLLSKRICHFKLYSIGDKFYGVGLIEPSYKSGIYKKNIEKGQANSIYARGFSPMIAYVGNERRMATPNDIKGVLDKIKKLNYQQYDSFPDWVKIESVKLNETTMARDALKDMRTDQIAALAAPQALVSGSGEATNRATLGDQRELWEFTLRDIVKKTMSYFKKYILKEINKYNDFGGVPEIEWGEIRAENVEINVNNIIKLLTAKNLNIPEEFIDDLVDELRELMNIKESENRGKYKYSKSGNNEEKVIPKEKVIKDTKIKEKDIKKNEEKMQKIIDKINLNEKEKAILIKSLEDKNNLEKQKLNMELELKEKDFNNKLESIKNDFVKELNKLSIEKNNKIKEKELNDLNKKNEVANDEIDTLLKEKQIKQLEKKEKIIKKLQEDIKDEK